MDEDAFWEEEEEDPRETRRFWGRAAEFFAQRPQYCGYLIQCYMRREGIRLDAVAERMASRIETLHRLCVCFRPRAETWDADIAALAGRFGIDPERLTVVLREGRQLAEG